MYFLKVFPPDTCLPCLPHPGYRPGPFISLNLIILKSLHVSNVWREKFSLCVTANCKTQYMQILYSHLCLDLSRRLFPSGTTTKPCMHYLLPNTCHVPPALPNLLRLIFLIIFFEYKSWSASRIEVQNTKGLSSIHTEGHSVVLALQFSCSDNRNPCGNAFSGVEVLASGFFRDECHL